MNERASDDVDCTLGCLSRKMPPPPPPPLLPSPSVRPSVQLGLPSSLGSIPPLCLFSCLSFHSNIDIILMRQFDYPVLNSGGGSDILLDRRDEQYRTDRQLIYRSVQARTMLLRPPIRPRPRPPPVVSYMCACIINSGDCPLPELHFVIWFVCSSLFSHLSNHLFCC